MSDCEAIDCLLKALAHPVRRQILRALAEPEHYFAEQQHPFDVGVCAGMIDQLTGLSQSSNSGHLAALQKAGLISGRKVGQWIFYQRNEDAIAALLQALKKQLYPTLQESGV
ncbi:ArsR/SmtB family transcription factor [Pokkaliibacter sp. CJK22405]|uniref:ArsR/SmtB family transcription factor n=1 Tax=Pokkaliibacter sp. CJK22405 TaxID=3384615 RepID=UPI0039853229